MKLKLEELPLNFCFKFSVDKYPKPTGEKVLAYACVNEVVGEAFNIGIPMPKDGDFNEREYACMFATRIFSEVLEKRLDAIFGDYESIENIDPTPGWRVGKEGFEVGLKSGCVLKFGNGGGTRMSSISLEYFMRWVEATKQLIEELEVEKELPVGGWCPEAQNEYNHQQELRSLLEKQNAGLLTESEKALLKEKLWARVNNENGL